MNILRYFSWIIASLRVVANWITARFRVVTNWIQRIDQNHGVKLIPFYLFCFVVLNLTGDQAADYTQSIINECHQEIIENQYKIHKLQLDWDNSQGNGEKQKKLHEKADELRGKIDLKLTDIEEVKPKQNTYSDMKYNSLYVIVGLTFLDIIFAFFKVADQIKENNFMLRGITLIGTIAFMIYFYLRIKGIL